MGTTQWELFRGYSLEDAKLIVEKSAGTGFTFAQVMLLGVGDGTKANVYGEKPWVGNDPAKPNEAYFRNVDAVVAAAGAKGLTISMTIYHQRYRPYITREKLRGWARWVVGRYKDAPNIVWSMTPEVSDEFVPVVRELAAGIREVDGGRHLITFKPDPAPHKPGWMHGEDWLDYSSMQVWKWIETIYSMVTTEYNLKPTKPINMGEGAYEAGSEYGFEVTPLWVRRQAYYSYLAGAHHAYGHNDSWRILPTWKQALDAPGAAQLGLLRKIFEARDEWWQLVPDQGVLASGGVTEGQVLNLAARHKDGKWAMVYCAAEAKVAVDMGKLAGKTAKAVWIDPRTAKETPAGEWETRGTREFATPKGWEDALLVLET